MKVTSYLNLNFEEEPYTERVELAAGAGVDGIELYGWDLGMDSVETLGGPFADREFDLHEVADVIHDHGLAFVYMSGNRPPLTDPDRSGDCIESIVRSLELADEVGCERVNVKAGPIQTGMTIQEQRRAVIDVLKRVAPTVADSDTTLVLEPINHLDDPTQFAHTARDGYELLDAVDSPDIKLLLDLYHEQRSRGNIIENVRENTTTYVSHFHAADPPSRGQPGTGELNWEHILEAIDETGYDEFIGGEFIPIGDPVEAIESLVELGHSI